MTLRQFVTLTEACDRVDVRRAMVAVLARERPRSVEGYRRFYWAVSLCLLINSARASVSFGLHTDCTAWRPPTSPLDFSVFSAAGGAFLLGAIASGEAPNPHRWCEVRQRPLPIAIVTFAV